MAIDQIAFDKKSNPKSASCGVDDPPSAAEVIARSIAEPPSRSKNTKTWAMPRSAPRASPKPALPRVKHRKKLEIIPQSRPVKARRAIGFIGLGVPEHTRHQVHTDSDQELFLVAAPENESGNKCQRMPVCSIVG